MPSASSSESPLVLDGALGEGGGQILRTALSLSLVTGRAFRIEGIRAKRSPSGLRPQHLACVRGAEAISGSTSEGAEVGSGTLAFFPQPVNPGEYLLEVGTAGSAPLLFQCLFYPLALAGGGQLTLRGGTHVPHSPLYHYLAWVWLPALEAYGFRCELHLKTAGFYPQGGGEFRAILRTAEGAPARVDLPSRGTLQDVEVASFAGGLPLESADRSARAAISALREQGIHADAENLPLPISLSRGTALLIRSHFENSFAGFSAIGEKGKPSDEVGREAASLMAEFMELGGALDPHLADQLLLPAALLAAGRLAGGAPGATRFTTSACSSHLVTNAEILRRFLPIRIDIQGTEVTVSPGE